MQSPAPKHQLQWSGSIITNSRSCSWYKMVILRYSNTSDKGQGQSLSIKGHGHGIIWVAISCSYTPVTMVRVNHVTTTLKIGDATN